MDFNSVHEQYTKINTLYNRDTRGRIIIGEFSRPEFKYLYDVKWLAFEKVDGTNASIYWDGAEFTFHGKTADANTPLFLLDKLKSLASEEKFSKVFKPTIKEDGSKAPMLVKIYGEGYGNKIGKVGNKYLLDSCGFRVFDIKINNFWLEWNNVLDICEQLGLETVIPYGELTLKEAEEMVIRGFKSTISENGSLNAEGLVLRPLVQLFNRKNERIMVKIKTCDYRKLGITTN